MNQVVQILKNSNRSKYELMFIEEIFYKTYTYIQSLKTKLELQFYYRIFQELQYEYHNKLDTIFEAGDLGRKIYFILQGSVAIFLPQSPNSCAQNIGVYQSFNEIVEKKYNQFKLITTLKQGTYFGEVALQNKCLRTASVVAVETLEVATLTYEVYQKIIRQAQQQIDESKLTFLKQLSIFEEWEESSLMIIMRNCEEKEFKPFTYIYKYNDKLDSMYFIITGEIKLSIYRYSQSDDIPHKVIKQILGITLLSDGQHFGDHEIYEGTQTIENKVETMEKLAFLRRQSDAWTQTYCRVYKLSMQQFIDNYQVFSNLSLPKAMSQKVNKLRSSMQELRNKIILNKNYFTSQLDPPLPTKRSNVNSSQTTRKQLVMPVRFRVQAGHVNSIDYSSNRSKSNDFFSPERLKQRFGYTSPELPGYNFTQIKCKQIKILNSKIVRRRLFSMK